MPFLRHSPIKALRRGGFALVCAALLIPLLAPAPKANAQVSFNIQVGTPPPVCPYGYYDFPPYPCAPPGFYGPGYFYSGIFLGVGPWANWGYAHGWGAYRFVGPRGGVYYPGYWRGHPHPHWDHRWDHARPYGYYAHHDRDDYDRRYYGHHDNGRHNGWDHDHHDNGRHNGHDGDHGHGGGHGDHGGGHGHDH